MHKEPCDGAGLPAEDVYYQTVICPVCKGIAPADDDKIGEHTILVFDWDDDEDDDLITHDVVIDAVHTPSELGTDVIREAARKLEAMSPEEKEAYLAALSQKANDRETEE